ncbi:hypothetical protein C8F04DRAFT_1395188 [Mycena alexandri]|uniref:Uncharacterized protein n=1 Tax=Mycena alexandri TaxID=1745969 RepID=A0AAD6X4P8_9AGAR|nr:hypothetical protein C8F04DRAFT_1395188 [Mycena alexandri]
MPSLTILLTTRHHNVHAPADFLATVNAHAIAALANVARMPTHDHNSSSSAFPLPLLHVPPCIDDRWPPIQRLARTPLAAPHQPPKPPAPVQQTTLICSTSTRLSYYADPVPRKRTAPRSPRTIPTDLTVRVLRLVLVVLYRARVGLRGGKLSRVGRKARERGWDRDTCEGSEEVDACVAAVSTEWGRGSGTRRTRTCTVSCAFSALLGPARRASDAENAEPAGSGQFSSARLPGSVTADAPPTKNHPAASTSPAAVRQPRRLAYRMRRYALTLPDARRAALLSLRYYVLR